MNCPPGFPLILSLSFSLSLQGFFFSRSWRLESLCLFSSSQASSTSRRPNVEPTSYGCDSGGCEQSLLQPSRQFHTNPGALSFSCDLSLYFVLFYVFHFLVHQSLLFCFVLELFEFLIVQSCVF